MSDYPMLISNKLHSFRNFHQQIYSIFVDLQTFAGKNITSPKPSMHHFPQELLGDREARGIANYGVDVAVGTFGCRFFV